MKIVALGFANFRSIGKEPIILDLQKRINLLIGANNSGKSNVLEILRRLKKERLDQIKLTEIDLHRRDGSRLLELVVDVEASEQAEVPEGVRRFHIAVSGAISRWIATPFDDLDDRQFALFMKKWLQRSWISRPSENDLRQKVEECAVASFRSLQNVVPEFEVIPQFRRITAGAYAIDGTGIVELLADWKAPEIGKDSDRTRFQKVQEFLRELLGENQIELDVSRTNPELIVERGGLRLPLKNYGTGVHQLIILAIAVLAKENSLIGIEEPEIHLHPLLQKALLRFLIEKTSNNYVITTHSNAFLSRPKDSLITHLLLSHLSLSRNEPDLSADELIKLLRINQNSAIIIDSDRTKADADINETKARIAKECKEAGVLCWVTAGREIENYITPESMAAVYDEMTGCHREFALGTYQKVGRVLENAYKSQWRAAFDYDNNKPVLARRIVPSITELPDRLDLKIKMRETRSTNSRGKLMRRRISTNDSSLPGLFPFSIESPLNLLLVKDGIRFQKLYQECLDLPP